MNEVDGQTGGRRFLRRDWNTAILIVLMAFLLRVPFRSQLAYHWDSAQFALAVNEYDMRLSQPHAPGYFLYIMLGRLVNGLVGDPHASLVWISVVFGSALPAVVYLLATAMFGRKAGVTAGLLALTSPQVWFHSCVALTYCVDSFLVCTVVLVLWRAMERGGGWRDAIVVGVLLALIGGVREQSVPALVPLVVYAFWRFERARLAKLAAATVVAIGLGAMWFVPMVQMSGGLRTYWDIVRLHASFNASATFLGHGSDALLGNLVNVAAACGNGLGLAAMALVAGLLYRAFWMADEEKKAWDSQHARALETMAVWIIPMMILGTVIGFTKQPGYVLSYLPGWFVLAGITMTEIEGGWQRTVLISVVCGANIVIFAAWPAQWNGVFFGMGRSARQIAEHDARLSQIVDAIRWAYSPKEVVICHAKEFYLYGLRHFQLYLPEYDQYQLAAEPTILHFPGRPIWRVRNGHMEFVDKLDIAGKEGLLLVVPPGEKVDIFAPYLSLASARVLPQAGENLYFIPVETVK